VRQGLLSGPDARRADNRRCFIMLFSSEVVHYELTSERGLEQAIRF
jgi:uncharacterized protein with von Willebrand factor type A (vWA) domain